jgi:glycerol-1-phosphate dehydrogenase [NAD(P)+]
LNGTYDVLIAAGSGTVHDITRYVANKRGVPFVSVPTAASVDGFSSVVAAMTLKGCKMSIYAGAPLYVLADTDIFSAAPGRLTASGAGDLLGKFTAIADWKIANLLTGEYICHEVIHLTERALAEALAARDDCERLMYGLLLSGLAMQMVGISRPASGGEHYISHFWEMNVINEPVDALHGEQVGVGLLICADEYHRISELLKQGKAEPFSVEGLLEKDLKAGFPDAEMREMLRKENTPDPLEGLSGSDIIDRYEDICGIIDAIPPADELSAIIGSFGGKRSMEDIGIDPALKEATMRYSPYVRSRLTMMKLRKLLGFV